MVFNSFGSGFYQGKVLAKPNPKADKQVVTKALASVGAREVDQIKQIGVLVLQVSPKAEAKVVEALSKNPNFVFAEPDYMAKAILTPNDPYYFSYQWHLPKISAPTAWDVTTGVNSVLLSVIDSGVDYNHPDLAGRVTSGYDFVNNDSDPADDNGHGTAVAGTAGAAGNNGLGGTGVAWGIALLPVKALGGDGSGSYSAIANGITYSADRGAKIINLSLGGTSSSRTLQSAIDYAWGKGCLIIAAAGNNGNNIAVYPAACNNVIAVSALNQSDTRTSWSNYGSYVDIAAPGENITTTWPGGGYISISGTSFSSPVVAGAAALALSVNPSLSNSRMVELFKSSSDDIGASGYDVYFGSGRVNASRLVAGATPVADTVSPVAVVTNPKNGTNISKAKSVSVLSSASDNVLVTRSELYINGVRVASSLSGSLSYTWNTSRLARGTYQLQSKAYDGAGNVGVSPVVSVYR